MAFQSTPVAAPVKKIAYHIDAGPTDFPYPIDAQMAVAHHPNEWRFTPWSPEDVAAARKQRDERYQSDLAAAKASGLPEPAQPVNPPALVLTPEEQAALDEFRANQAKAKALLDSVAKEEAEAAAKADAVAQAKALLEQPPPMPDPKAPRRPFGRTGALTPAEQATADKRAAAKKDADAQAAAAADAKAKADAKAAADKAAADRATQQQT